jgi:hypothetical protein
MKNTYIKEIYKNVIVSIKKIISKVMEIISYPKKHNILYEKKNCGSCEEIVTFKYYWIY